MKSLFKLMAVVAVAVMCAGYAYNQLKPEDNIQTKWFVETARSGDCFNTVIENYYDESIKANKSWDEWQTQQKEYNQQLFANGRSLQVGDKILIVTKVRVAK